MDIFSWVKSCKDNQAAIEILEYETNLMKNVKEFEDAVYQSRFINKYKQEIYQKWGSHIPELKAQIREDKINSILE